MLISFAVFAYKAQITMRGIEVVSSAAKLTNFSHNSDTHCDSRTSC